MAVVSLIIAVVAMLVAGASAAYTRKQAMAATDQTAIEQKRWHADLTPQLEITCDGYGADGSRADLMVELTGPAGLDQLDEVTVKVRDDIPDRRPGFGSQLTAEQISEVIWGPYRINTGPRDTDSTGRAHGPFRVLKNEPYPIPLERSFAPAWASSPTWWREQYQGEPVRLEITCSRQGHEPWVIQREAKVSSGPHCSFGKYRQVAV
jgi:hypothetical protein